MNLRVIYPLVVSLLIFSCSSNDEQQGYIATPLPLEIPELFSQYLIAPVVPPNNPQTVEGVALGRKLFFDPILSGNSTQACADCHRPQNAFSDPRQFSIGIEGNPGFRNSMPLQNLAWNFPNKFNWDGSASSLENQIFEPVTNPIEMNNTWHNAVSSLQANSEYPQLFKEAFNGATIDSVLVTKAIAQFIRTLISGNSRVDRHLLGENILTPQELNGLNVFMSEELGDCFHCHGNPFNPLWTDNSFHNNGLDAFLQTLPWVA